MLSLQEISSWFPVGEQFSVAFMVDTMHQWEFNLSVMELFDMSTTSFTGGNGFHFNNLNGMSSCTMASAHVPVTLRDCSTHGQITVFAVHVVGAGTRIIPQPDAKILDFDR